jgi:glycosyltransferase involved in cell wall biosynthesis
VFGATESAAAVRRAVDMMAIDAASGKLGTQTRATWVTAPLGRAKLPCRLDRLARWQNLNNWNVVPHGVDLSSFRPLDKTSARKVFALPQSAFVVGSVNTNQFRKRQDITMRAFAVLRRRVPDAILVLHCSGGDSQGWDLAQLADYLGITDSVFLVHHSHPQLSEEQLAALYNTFDVHLNTSGGEGWGLTSVESAACGVPQMVPNWSATREIWQRWGVLLPVENWRYEPKGLNTAHCQVSVEQTAELLVEIAQNHAYRERLGLLAQQRAGQQFGWDRVGMAFEEIMQRALKEPRAVGLSVEEMIRDRVGRVDSELAGVLTQSDYRARYGAEVTQPQK